MHTSFLIDIVFASLMALGGSAGIVKMYVMFSGDLLPKDIALALIDLSWKNLFNLGWNSRYHLMTIYNVACFAAIAYWHLTLSATVIAVLYVASMIVLLSLKHKLLRAGTLAA